MFVVLRVVVCHPGLATVHVGTAQILGGDDLPRGGFHQRRSAQENRSLVAHDDGLIGHGGQVGAPGGAAAEHRRELGDSLCGHAGLIVEGATEVLPVRKHLVLLGQEGAPGIHQIQAGEAVLFGDGLGPGLLLHGQGVVGSPLHGRIVDEDHALPSAHAADAGDQTGAGYVVLVHVVGRELGELEKGRAGIEQRVQALPGQQLASFHMALARFFTTAKAESGYQFPQLCNLALHGLAVGRGGGVIGIEASLENCHGQS